jgi:hypothetical protein
MDNISIDKKLVPRHMLEITPDYYKGDYVMKIIEDFKLDFLTGTIIKYLLRAGKKESEIIDLRKAQWYLDRKIGNLEK